MKTDSDLMAALREYVSPRLPFGPVDSTNIDEPECQARLFEWQNTAFAELLRGSNVIVGRRGSGKSALVKMVRNSGYLESRFRSPRGREYRDAFNVSLNDLNFHAALVVDVDLPQQMFEMEIQFSKIAVMPRVEVVAQHWMHRLFFLIGDEIRKSLPKFWRLLPTGAQRYITAADLLDLDPSDRASTLSANDFSEQIRDVLAENRKKVILTFDSLEDYRFDKTQNVILSGLFRAVGQLIARQKSPVDVKLCLPAEIYEFIKPNILNPDKDVTKKQFLHWTAIELMHIAAHRLKVYFEVFEPEEFAQVRDMHLRDRQQLRAFWR
jgi:hypothetical protein